MALLDDLILRFSKATTAFSPLQILECAIEKAHTDMSRRANGHKPVIQAASIKWLKNRFTTSSPFSLMNQVAFDDWHRKTCEAYCKHMNQQFAFSMTYGRAQKVLNMIFKYLYCTAQYKTKVDQITPFLHMTLDGYTLRWYKEVVVKYINDHLPKGVKKLKAGVVSDWSKMDQGAYIDIQYRIKNYLQSASDYQYTINASITYESTEEPTQNRKTIIVNVPFDPQRKFPFFAEFIIWEGEIARAKIETLLKGLNSTYTNWSNDQWAVNSAAKANLKQKLLNLYQSI